LRPDGSVQGGQGVSNRIGRKRLQWTKEGKSVVSERKNGGRRIEKEEAGASKTLAIR